ncbi:MAG: sigma-70 family RNA polymerase sigma factor [Actinomycetota bacterium]
MSQDEWLAQRFEAHRPHLRSVAYRMLGSATEADDAVQEAWLRLSRADAGTVENLGGWLTTVVARVSLDVLRARKSRREAPLDLHVPDPNLAQEPGNPEHEQLLADSVGVALQLVLDTLAPAERLAFVLHDLFAVPFDEIAQILGRTPTAVRQLASRARRRVQSPGTTLEGERAAHRRVVDAFLAASRNGEFEALVELLDPDAVIHADRVAVETGASSEVNGAAAVAETFSGRARAVRPALVDGFAGAVWSQGGQPKVVFAFTIEAEKIVEIELLADPEQLARLDLAIP